LKIIRYINDQEISGAMPPLQIKNPGVIQIIQNLQVRIAEEAKQPTHTNNG
jgi:hypothetical protein